MQGAQTFRGIATISFWADDLDKAKAWYTELLGIEPYFERPGYAEFRLGDYQQELGLIDRRYAPAGLAKGPGGATLYWHVDDISAVLDKLLSMGVEELEAMKERGGGFITASVVDPFGNIIGIMNNPHYVKVRDSIRGEWFAGGHVCL